VVVSIVVDSMSMCRIVIDLSQELDVGSFEVTREMTTSLHVYGDDLSVSFGHPFSLSMTSVLSLLCRYN